jgi:hypothetical protein
MFGTEEMLFVLVLIALTAAGSYQIARNRFLKMGLELGTEMTIDALIDDGFLETKTDKDGDEALVTIQEVKARYK